MNKIFVIAFVISSFFFSFVADANSQGKLPNLELTTIDGKAVSLHNLPGKLNVFNFWASWCSPCRRELPELSEVADKYKDKQVFFVAVSEDEKKSAMEKYLKSNPLKMSVIADNKHILAQKIGISSLPTVLIVDKKGNIVYSHNGYMKGDGKRLERKIITLLAKKE